MSTPSPAAQTKGSETMKRLTSITPEGILFLNASLEKYAAQGDVEQAKKELAKEVLMGGVQDDRP